MTADYIGHVKSGHQCSETFVNVFVFFTPHLHQRIGVFTYFCINWHACPDFLQWQGLAEQFPEKWYSNRYQNFLTLAFPAFALKFLYISNQLSGRLKASATEQKNDINNWKSMKNPHNRFEKIRPEARLISTSQNVSTCVVDGVPGGENLRDVLLGNWDYGRANHFFRTRIFLKIENKVKMKVLTYPAFEIRFGSRQLLRLLPEESCIFFNVRLPRQNCLNNIYVKNKKLL